MTKTAATPTRNAPASVDAITLLDADHKAVSELFARFDSANSVSGKQALVAELCAALGVHAQIEEEVFYPAVKLALKDKVMIPEAIIEHASLKGLIATLEGIDPDGEMYDANVKVLSEYVKHHVEEERDELFPKVRASSIDILELGARLAARKQELMAKAASAA